MPDREGTERGLELGEDREWLLQLAKDLQQTLQVAELLSTFSGRIRELVPHDHLSFATPDGEERFACGASGPHACSYDVVLPEQRLGTVTFGREEPFTGGETHALENVLLNLVYPLRNALMYEAVVQASGRDGLTTLGNRAALEATLGRSFAAANRHGDPLSLIMLDVDCFKQVNDEHGHPSGDEVLRALARLLVEEIRSCDLAFRYGGDEFVVVLEKTDVKGAGLLAERIRKRAERTEITTPSGVVRVTVSLGVAMLEPGDTKESVLLRADAALYASKTSGRNRVTARTRLDEGGTPPAAPAKRKPMRA